MADWTVLQARLRQPDLANLSDADAVAALNAPITQTVPVVSLSRGQFLLLLAPAAGQLLATPANVQAKYQVYLANLRAGDDAIVVSAIAPLLAQAVQDGVLTQAQVDTIEQTTVQTSLALQLAGWGVPVTLSDILHARGKA